jgi:hypothetical protein
MPVLPRYETAYAEYVKTSVIARLAEGQWSCNYKELADKVGLKPTQHFKRRVRQMVERHMLQSFTAFTPRGGLEIRFCLPPVGEIPF